MAVNKVIFNTADEGSRTLIDLTEDTVTPETLAEGVTAHDASGEVITGTMPTSTVLYTEQTLTDTQKAQARTNIGAMGGKMSRSVQYVHKANLVNDTFWINSDGGIPFKYSYSNYSVLEPIVLPAGTYYLSALSAPYSFVVDSSGVVTRMDSYTSNSSVTTGGFVLTLNETSTVYLGYYTPTQITDHTPYIIEGTRPLAADDYFEGEIFGNVNCDVFIESYIKNCELVANELNVTGDTQGHYTGAKMDSHITQMRCKARFITNASVALITTNRGSSMVTDITGGSIHLVFSIGGCSVGIFDTAGNLRGIAHYSYTIAEDIEVSFGFDINEASNALTVYLPDGTTKSVTDADVSVRNGQYAIWEHFCNTASAGFAFCKMTKLYCKDTGGEVLDDNLKRLDGAIGVAPTGQPYRQFTTHNLTNRDFK